MDPQLRVRVGRKGRTTANEHESTRMETGKRGSDRIPRFRFVFIGVHWRLKSGFGGAAIAHYWRFSPVSGPGGKGHCHGYLDTATRLGSQIEFSAEHLRAAAHPRQAVAVFKVLPLPGRRESAAVILD